MQEHDPSSSLETVPVTVHCPRRHQYPRQCRRPAAAPARGELKQVRRQIAPTCGDSAGHVPAVTFGSDQAALRGSGSSRCRARPAIGRIRVPRQRPSSARPPRPMFTRRAVDGRARASSSRKPLVAREGNASRGSRARESPARPAQDAPRTRAARARAAPEPRVVISNGRPCATADPTCPSRRRQGPCPSATCRTATTRARAGLHRLPSACVRGGCAP